MKGENGVMSVCCVNYPLAFVGRALFCWLRVGLNDLLIMYALVWELTRTGATKKTRLDSTCERFIVDLRKLSGDVSRDALNADLGIE